MTICKDCFIPMVGVMSFSKDRHERFCRCPRCKAETRSVSIRNDELDFREILNEAGKKGK